MPERTDLLRVALAQLNPTVGDIRGNARKISDGIARARDEGASLVVFPELCLTGYPPEDLLLKTTFLDAADAALQELAGQTQGIAAVVGYPEKAEDVYNSAAVLADGDVVATYRKMYLPNYGVFDEQRYFQSGAEAAIVELNGVPIGLSICEDIWEPGPPAMTEALAGAQVILNLSASPYRRGVGAGRERMLIQRAVDNLTAVVFVNTVGGQDELVFDGHSLAIDQDGQILARAPQFEEALTICTIDPRAITAARLRDTRHRANVRRQRRAGHAAEPPVFTLASINTEASGERRAGVRRAGRHAGPRGGGLRRAAHRPARLRGEERLRASGDRALRRDRLRAGGARGRGRARTGARHVRVDALPLLERGHAKRRARDRREPRRRLPRDRHRAARWTRTRRCCARPSTAASRT